MESTPPPPPMPPPMKTSKRRAATTPSIAGLTCDDSVLPIELIIEILVRLPVKSLLKMRSVSKSWNSLISTPQFVKSHLKLSANNREFAHHRLLSIRSGFHTNDDGHMSKWKYFCTYSLYAILYGESPCFPVELHNFGVSYEVLGSCDGLFVISKTWYNDIDDLFLWNPSIRKLNKLPYSGIDVSKGRFAYGFGYIECQNDYQIVEIVESKSSYLISHISVYSLRSNSWKSIQEFPSISLRKHVKFVKGKLHWITRGGGGDGNVSWFNPGDETFGNVALPNPSGDTLNWKLVSSSGNLCMTCDCRNKRDVWIMKEYGLVESWTIVASIPKFVNKVVWPIFISHNDEILLQDVSGLVWWYVIRDDDTFDRPQDQTRCEFDRGSELNLYVESLVSPNSP